MGFSPQQVREMSAWQYAASLEGYIAANSADDDTSMTADESDDVWGWIEGL